MTKYLIVLAAISVAFAQEINLKPQFINPDPPASAPPANPSANPESPNPATKPNPPAQNTSGNTTLGKPNTQSPTPQPVDQQQPPAKPGEQGQSYGNSGLGSMFQNLMNRMSGDRGEYYDGPSGSRGEYFGPGVLQKCDSPSSSAQKAFEEAKNFRASCSYAQRGDSQKIAVNDYSTRPSYMYIFDLQGKCLGKTMVAFGNGASGSQIACSDHGSNLSPPGFHLTAEHHGSGKYNPGNSMKMVGLQGQDSAGRGILIHPSRAPGTSSTWGCAGVGYSAFGAVKRTLGYGALVYNYWRPEQMGNACRSRAGMNSGGGCQPDRGSPAIPSNATGEGTPTVTQWASPIREAWASQFPAQRLKIKKGTEVIITRELVASGTYEVKMTREEAVGPNVAALSSLKKALGFAGESSAEFKKRLERDTGAVYLLKADLQLLWEEEIFRLQKQK